MCTAEETTEQLKGKVEDRYWRGQTGPDARQMRCFLFHPRQERLWEANEGADEATALRTARKGDVLPPWQDLKAGGKKVRCQMY